MVMTSGSRMPPLTLERQESNRTPQRRSINKFLLILGIALIGWNANAVSADTLPVPEGDVLLVISGALVNTNHENEAHFDRAMLESLPRTEFSTDTPWADGVQRFAGVRLSDLFEYIGAAPTGFIAEGLDDYKFTVEELDVQNYPTIIAYEHNGNAMSVRKLGPLRIMFPFDDHPELLTPINEASAVWQLIKMDLF